MNTHTCTSLAGKVFLQIDSGAGASWSGCLKLGSKF